LDQGCDKFVQSEPGISGLRPKLRLKPIIFLGACFAVLVVASYFNREPHRAFYGGLAAAVAIAMIVQYCRETALARNALSATAVVTSYRVVGKHAPYFGKGVPVFKYEFVAFDQKIYRGETGWGAAGLQNSSRFTVLYNPEDPARSHPLHGFVFYSLAS
jgi:hypothetical protein